MPCSAMSSCKPTLSVSFLIARIPMPTAFSAREKSSRAKATGTKALWLLTVTKLSVTHTAQS